MNLGILSAGSAASDTAEPASALSNDMTSALPADTAPAPAPVEPEIITIVINEPLPASAGGAAAAAGLAGRVGVALPVASVAPTEPTEAPTEPTVAPAPEVTYPIFDVGDAGEVALQFSAGSISFWGCVSKRRMGVCRRR